MKRKDILYILIPACLLVFAWIAFNIYHNAVTSTIPQATSIQIAPIVPTFDTKTIDSLKRREIVAPVFESQVSPTPVGSQSAITKSATASAAQRGNL